MAQNLFMAQTCFLISLRKLDKTYRKRFAKGNGRQITPSLCANQDEMLCLYICVDKHDFFFKLFQYKNLNYVLYKVTAEAFVLFFRLSQTCRQRDYFLAVPVKVDKCFSETYTYTQVQGFICQLSLVICTKCDLIYLQKAFYEIFDTQKLSSLFYPLQEHSHKDWASKLMAQTENLTLSNVDFEYTTVKVVSAEINTQGFTGAKLGLLFKQITDVYYALYHRSFDVCWKDDAVIFASRMISGNDNINNIFHSHIELFNQSYFTNKHEKTFASESGIVFMQTHYPFDLTAEENAKLSANKLSIPWKNGPEGVENICELCSALHFLKQIKRIRFRLKEQCVIGIRRVLAKIVKQLSMERVHLADIDKKFEFIFNVWVLRLNSSKFRKKQYYCQIHQICC